MKHKKLQWLTVFPIWIVLFQSCNGEITTSVNLIGGSSPGKNPWIFSIPKGSSASITFGDKGDGDFGEILFRIPVKSLKNYRLFYAGYPNGSTLRFEIRIHGKPPQIIDLQKKPGEAWLEIPPTVFKNLDLGDSVIFAAIDENDQFKGWVGLAVAPKPGVKPGVLAMFWNEWRQPIAIVWVLLIGLLICGPVLFCEGEGEGMIRCSLAMLGIGFWCMLAFYIALWLPGAWQAGVSFLALVFGLVCWISRIGLPWKKPNEFLFSSSKVSLGAVAACCFLFPIISAGPSLQSEDPFPVAQNLYLEMPIDNRIPWILAEACLKDEYRSPLFLDWLGSDRPPLQSGWIILMKPFLGWLPPAAAAFASSYAAQGLWILGAIVMLKGAGFFGSPVKCGLITATLSGLVLLNGIFTWPKLMSGGFLFACAGMIFRQFVRQPAPTPRTLASLACAGLLAGLALQCHGSAAFAILPMAGLLLFRKGWHFETFPRIAQKGLIFGSALIFIQMPWALWQKIGDPPGNRLIKWHLAGCIPIDPRSAGQAILESYQKISPTVYLENKLENVRALFQFPQCSPWLELANRRAAVTADFFGVFPAISWALPSWLGLVFLGLCQSRVRNKMMTVFSQCLGISAWFMLTAIVWIVLMFIPGSTLNHQGPMNLALVGLLLSGVILGSVSPRLWSLAALVQAAGVIWIYGDEISPFQVNFGWSLVLGVMLTIMVWAAVFPIDKKIQA